MAKAGGGFAGKIQGRLETISKGLRMKLMGICGPIGGSKDGMKVKTRMSKADSRFFMDAWRHPCLRSLSHRVEELHVSTGFVEKILQIRRVTMLARTLFHLPFKNNSRMPSGLAKCLFRTCNADKAHGKFVPYRVTAG
jgi:hypothetical protein